MSFTEDLFKLRQKFQDALTKGVVSEDGKDIFEATLIQVLNDAEKNRQNCVSQSENLRRQASVFDGQASAFASVSSIVYNVLNGFVIMAERAEQEKLEQEKESLERSEDLKKALEIEEGSAPKEEEHKKPAKKKTSASKQ